MGTTATLSRQSANMVFGHVSSTKGLRNVFLGESVTASGFKKGIGALGHLVSVPIAAGAAAALSMWDHRHEKRRITSEFQHEIAAQTGKHVKDVKLSDMENAAKRNPVIAQAVNTSAKKRNLSIGVTVASAAAGLAFGAFVVPAALGALGVTTAVGLVSFIATGAGFVGIEYGLNKIGGKVFKLDEPDMHAIDRKPSRQGELSVPSQIHYLARQQGKHKTITQAQVMSVFLSANPKIASIVKSAYGAPFEKLSSPAKADALARVGSMFNVAQITEDLNHRHMRAQELAFTAYGQASGVPSLRPVTAEVALEAPSQEATLWQDRMRARNGQQSLAGGIA